MPGNLPNGGLRFRIQVGDESVDLLLDGNSVEVNGKVRLVDAVPLGHSLWSFLIDGRSVTAHIEPLEGGRIRVTLGNRAVEVRVRGDRDLLLERTGSLHGARAPGKEIRAPMPGLVLAVLVQAGQRVEPGSSLVVIEAMKMENEIRAPVPAVVRAVHVSPGDAVTKNTLLIELAPPDASE